MSAVLRKRIPRREEELYRQFLGAVVPATILILTIVLLLTLMGHFYPAH
jgi:hypothetical protein